MSLKPEVVAEDTGLGEGPVWCPDATLVVTSVDRGQLIRVWPESGRTEVIAETLGSANGAQVASDGGFVVTQSGGHDLSPVSPTNPDRDRDVPVFYREPAAPRYVEPGLQRAMPDGSVVYLANEGFQSPNDLIVGADGTVYLTDPCPFHSGRRDELIGRVWAYRPDGSTELLADGFWYCNGIGLDLDGTIIVVERSGLQHLYPDGTRDWLIESMGRSPGVGAGDGFCLDAEGRIYCAFNMERGIKVVEDGKVVDFLPVPEGPPGIVTNCCFGGADLRTLFVCDGFNGRVLAWEHMPTAGLPLTPWPVPETGQTHG